LIAERLHHQGLGISASQVGRILADLDLKPHLVRGWLNRPDDPDFFAAPRTCAGCTWTGRTRRWC
jgi:hypothetical protein